ncbi:hypothetical protein C0J52_03219 [Blattella germanica]|nr:hypothetical protein C0J52_03219 [Blattella germanica]
MIDGTPKEGEISNLIHHHHDWMLLLRLSGKNKPFVVSEMTTEDFYDFSGLLGKELMLRKFKNLQN